MPMTWKEMMKINQAQDLTRLLLISIQRFISGRTIQEIQIIVQLLQIIILYVGVRISWQLILIPFHYLMRT